MSDVKGKALIGADAFNDGPVFLHIRNGGNVLCIASPRYGKGALCKNIAVQVAKFKKVCVFDYRGEWAGHVTAYNPDSEYPECLSDYFIAENFAFKLTDFDQRGDWVGFGFEDDAAEFLQKIIRSQHHGGELSAVRDMIRKLPTKDDDVLTYNEEFGVDLLVSIHPFTKGALGRRFEVVQRYFWRGVEDTRQLFNFAELWRQYKHLIIDLSDRKDGFKDIGKARAYAGLILRQMRPAFEQTQGFYVVEEASQLLANPKRLPDGNIIGYSEFHKLVEILVTLGPKQGVNLLVMAQSRNQVYENIVSFLPILFVGRLNELDDLNGRERELNGWIRVYPGSTRREWFMIDTFYGINKKFVAAVPRCLYETNR